MIKATLAKRAKSASSPQDSAEDALRRLGMALAGRARDRLLELDLTPPQLRILRAIERPGRASGRQLADEFRVTPAAIAQVCVRLEALGMLRRVRDTEDRRICWFELTAEGASTLNFVGYSIHSQIKPALAALKPEDLHTLVRILNVLADALTS
jgi:DNA-binding MarR family transcriptional regulator